MRGEGVDPFAAEQNAAAIEFAEAGDHPQERGLSAAGGPKQREEFTVADCERNVVDRAHAAESTGDPVNRDGSHPR